MTAYDQLQHHVLSVKSLTLTIFDSVSLTTLFTSTMIGTAMTHGIEVVGVSFEVASTSTPVDRSDRTGPGAVSVVPTGAGETTPMSLAPGLPDGHFLLHTEVGSVGLCTLHVLVALNCALFPNNHSSNFMVAV